MAVAGRDQLTKLIEEYKCIHPFDYALLDGDGYVVTHGADGALANETVAKSPADGYNLFMVSGPHAVAPSLSPRLNYDLMRDFQPITMIGVEQLCLVVHPSLPVKTVREFTAFLKGHRGEVSYGSSGSGSVNHLAMEMFQSVVGVRLIHIPYKGTAFALPDVINGRVPVLFANLSPLKPHIQTGRLRPLGVTSARRSPVLPEVRAIREAGFPDYGISNWMGVFAPPQTPGELAMQIRNAFAEALKSQEVRKVILNDGQTIVGGTPEQLQQEVAREFDKIGALVRSLNLAK